MNRFSIVPILAAAVLQMASSWADAQPFFAEDFEVDPSANWTVNTAPGVDETHNFSFDYSTLGIPLAPNSAPGDSRGLKLQANVTSNILGGVSVSPVGQSFAGNYTLVFDWWSSFTGPAPEGITGSTQLSTFGIETSGTVAQWVEGTQDSIWFGATGDGHSASDWRAYSPTAPLRYADASGVYAAGIVGETSNADHLYYAGFGGVAPPSAQTALFPTQQTGISMIGSSAFEWHRVEIAKNGAFVTWRVDGLLIATVPLADDTVGLGNNIFFGHSDINATSAIGNGQLIFTLIDNVQVVPEPGVTAMLALGVITLIGSRRRARTTKQVRCATKQLASRGQSPLESPRPA